MADNKKTINIYTDGACAGNQEENNLGGWGAVLEYGKHTKEAYGGEINTTNNRMELTALVKALEMLKEDGLNIRVFSDSSYLVRCMNEEWYKNWQKNGWKNANKKPVENQDLWEKIIEYLPKHNFSFYHIKGHVNLNSTNTDVDRLYKKFVAKNGNSFSKDDFRYLIKMNNVVDALANEGIDSISESAEPTKE